jgi:hypothetical protein
VIQPAEGHRLNSGPVSVIKAGRGGRRPGAGRPSRPKPQPSPAEEAVFEAVRVAVNQLLKGEAPPALADVAGALARLLARARAL